jgi:hypothetical protein
MLNELDSSPSFTDLISLKHSHKKFVCPLVSFALKSNVLRTSEQMHSLNGVQEGALNKIDKLYYPFHPKLYIPSSLQPALTLLNLTIVFIRKFLSSLSTTQPSNTALQE